MLLRLGDDAGLFTNCCVCVCFFKYSTQGIPYAKKLFVLFSLGRLELFFLSKRLDGRTGGQTWHHALPPPSDEKNCFFISSSALIQNNSVSYNLVMLIIISMGRSDGSTGGSTDDGSKLFLFSYYFFLALLASASPRRAFHHHRCWMNSDAPLPHVVDWPRRRDAFFFCGQIPPRGKRDDNGVTPLALRKNM